MGAGSSSNSRGLKGIAGWTLDSSYRIDIVSLGVVTVINGVEVLCVCEGGGGEGRRGEVEKWDDGEEGEGADVQDGDTGEEKEGEKGEKRCNMHHGNLHPVELYRRMHRRW